MLALFVVFLLVGCLVVNKSAPTYHTAYDPQCCPNQGSARVITKEESAHITTKKEIDIVELTNNQFKIQVYFIYSDLRMRLIVPAGKELFIKEPFVEIFDTATQQELDKFHVNWFRGYSQLGDDTGRLIGLISSPPATLYETRYSVRRYAEVEGKPQEKTIYIDLKLPVFRTKENETIKFNDVTFKISLIPDEYTGGYQMIPLIPY
jgi:hypothetical protein